MNTDSKIYKADRKALDEALVLKPEANQTLKAIYEHAIGAHQKNVASIYFDEDGKTRKMDYAEYDRRVHQLAARLSTAFEGLGDGPVGLKMRNSENWPLLFWALLMNGREVLLLDFRLAHANAENIIRQAGAVAVLSNEVEPYEVKSLRLNEIMMTRPNPSFVPNWGDKAIFASSGTTGDAKLIEMTGRNLANQVMAALNLPEENTDILPPDEVRNLGMIPFHHIFGFTAVFLWYTFYGKAIVYPSSTSTRDIMAAIRNGKCTHIYSVPMFWDSVAQTLERTIALKGGRIKDWFEKLVAYNSGEISKKEAGFAGTSLFRKIMQKKAFGTQVRYCITGGGAIGQHTIRLVNGIGYKLGNGYGMTEIGVASVEKRPDARDRNLATIGTLFQGFEAKIRGDKEEGELLIKSPTVHMTEIVGGKRVPTKLEEGGYFATGDIATIDEGGHLRIKGRLKDTIIDTNGENVYPDEIEDYFRGMPHAKNVAVFGAERNGREQICLVIETDNDMSEGALEATRKAFEEINATLPHEKKVDFPYIYRKALPISGSMKVKRFQLRDDLKSGSKDFIHLFGEKEADAVDTRFDGIDPERVDNARKRVRKFFANNLHLLEEKIGNTDVWDKDLGGDSMSYVAMVSDINDEFHIEVPVELYGKIGTVDDFAYEALVLRGYVKKDGANS